MSGAPAATVARSGVSRYLEECPIVAVLRAPDAGEYDRVVDVLVERGIRSIELTLTTPGTFDRLAAIVERYRSDAEIGVGTITSLDAAAAAIAGGADYLVTPVLDREVIALAVDAGLPVYPGALTPTEVFAAWTAGATAVKIFPAQTVGAQYGAHLRGPFPDLRFIPSGGVGLDDVGPWLRGGASAVSLGGPLIGDALNGGSLDALAERCRRALALIDEERAR